MVQLASAIDRFRDQPVVVIGDLMIDQYIRGDVTRISPEAPVPVVEVRARDRRLGGAANAAANVRALGGATTVIGVVGDDEPGTSLVGLTAALGITARLVTDATRPTTVKTRLVAHGQQIVRMDDEARHGVSPAIAAALLAEVDAALPGASACVISDYVKGVITAEVAAGVIARCRARGIPVIVDPKHDDFRVYRGATILTPNVAELDRAVALRLSTSRAGGRISEAAIVAEATALLPVLDGAALLVTRSADGMTLVRTGVAPVHTAALAQEVFDVTGAGDTVIAALALALAAGIAVESAIEVASVAAAVSVSKRGTSTVTVAELLAALAR